MKPEDFAKIIGQLLDDWAHDNADISGGDIEHGNLFSVIERSETKDGKFTVRLSSGDLFSVGVSNGC